ncbi:toll/interleukin-1 receptor domain-containing protein [Lentzea chajnantorensis]
MAGVFVNYRVKDNPYGAASITQVLRDHFGADLVFRDAVSMEPGTHYPSEIRRALHEADVLVAVVGPHWLVPDPGTGRPRLESPGDWVHDEIAHALANGIPIVPVLLEDAPRPKHGDLPAGIRGFASIQAQALSHRRFHQDMAELVARLVGLVPSLVVPSLFAQPPQPFEPGAAPSTLLLPERAVVPFHGRDRELADLVAWAHASAPNAARLVVGPAGCGRTRLAVELCRRMTADGWLAGLLAGQAPAAQIRRTSAVDRPLLAVVDDAEQRSEQLVALAEAVAARSAVHDAPTRLLLLGRSDGSWLTALREHRDDRVAALFRTAGRSGTVTLQPCPPGLSITTAVTAFAGVLGVEPVAVAAPPGTVLDLQARALTAVLGETGPDPLAALHRHDVALRAGSPSLAIIGTLATLCAPASAEEAEALVVRLPDFLGQAPDAVRTQVAAWSRLHPGPYPLTALRPDALGEHLVAATLAEHPALVTTVAVAFPDEWLTTALTVLGRALPRHPGLLDAVTALFHAAPRRLEPLVSVALTRLDEPEPFARAIANEMGKLDWSMQDVMSLLQNVSTGGTAHDPLRGAAMEALLKAWNGFTDQIRSHSGTPVAPPPEPLGRILTGLTKLAEDFAVSFVDPGSGRAPRGPDGKPLLPPQVMGVLRDLYTAQQREKGDQQDG